MVQNDLSVSKETKKKIKKLVEEMMLFYDLNATEKINQKKMKKI